jgi:hypothetical protein
MTRNNILQTLIISGTMLAAIGCGDPSVDERSLLDEPTAIGPSESVADASLEEELELACESSCDAIRACPGMYVTTDCVDSCIATFGVGAEADEECAAARIDLLNCYSALDCSALPFEDEGECADAVTGFLDTCETEGLRARVVPESDRELVLEIGDPSESSADDGAEETGPADGSEEEEPEFIDVTDPIVIAEIPDSVLNGDVPWFGGSDDD